MKKSLFFWALTILLLFSILCTGQELSSALNDIKSQNVTRSTITKLETASLNSGEQAESLYNLARIYQFNPRFIDIKQARLCYYKVLSMYQMSSFGVQLNKLNSNYGVDANSLRNTIKGIDDMISNDAFSETVQNNSFDGYVKYVAKYPNSPQLNAAKDKALAIKKSENTIAGYASYLSAFPDYRTDEVKQMALNVAKSKNTYESYTEMANSIPGYNTDEVSLLTFKTAVAQHKYSTQAEFSRNFPKLCSNITQTIDLMEKEPLDSRGKEILKSLKLEYINSATDLASLNAAIKKYPILSFNYNERYYESLSAYNSQLAELNRLKPSLSSALSQKLANEAANSKSQFVNSWKESPAQGKKVANGYPEMNKTIDDGLYSKIASMSVGTKQYNSSASAGEIQNELVTLNSNISYCNDFLGQFGNSSHAGDAKAKRNALEARKKYVSDCEYNYIQKEKYNKQRLAELREYIIERGRTPHYTLGEWYSEGILSADELSAKCDVDFGNYSAYYQYALGGKVYKNGNSYKAWLEKVGGSKWAPSRGFNSIDQAVKFAVWEIYYGNLAEWGDQDLLNYLEQHKNDTWWGYIFK